jgi:hypothetical protein
MACSLKIKKKISGGFYSKMSRVLLWILSCKISMYLKKGLYLVPRKFA